VVGLIHFLLSLPLAYHWLPNGQPMACQTKGRRSACRSRAGHALTGQYLGASLNLAVSSALPTGFNHSALRPYAGKPAKINCLLDCPPGRDEAERPKTKL
jgi:hypothetical protein